MTQKTLNEKLHHFATNPSCRDFILADAKDPDMAFGISATGADTVVSANNRKTFRSLEEFRSSIRQIVAQGYIDIMLMSASSNAMLNIQEDLFAASHVTPAVRMNDSTDIWCPNSGAYTREPSIPFRSTTIEHARYGQLDSAANKRGSKTELGLYSITFNNCSQLDAVTLDAFAAFREEAERKKFPYFLEVFLPNAPVHPVVDLPRYLNDCIVRTLAGITPVARPVFLKIPYLGAAAMEELVHYDPSLVVGVLGGSTGTTHDAFHLLYEAKKHGARAALFGRKINQAENQLAFVKILRHIADDEIKPVEAVKEYHNELHKLGTPPHRNLDSDLQLTQRHE